MPRMSAAEKKKSHERILGAAARLFRERGVEATSVADVMRAAGLTHGGFYKHFPSKQALVAEAFHHAAEALLSGAEAEAAPGGPARAEARVRYMARYLSGEHIGDAAHGCPIAALGADLARGEGPARTEATRALERMAAILGPDAPGADDSGLALTALLVGTVTLARLAEKPDLSARILEAGKRAADLLEECSEEGAATGGKVT